jgi:hypothetical protein
VHGAHGVAGADGIPPKNLTFSIGKHPGNLFNVFTARSYRSTRAVAVVL